MLKAMTFAVSIACCACAFAAVEQGIAAKYPSDVGLRSDPACAMFLDFEKPVFNGAGYGMTTDPALVFSGNASLEMQNTVGTHQPEGVNMGMKPVDCAFVRWYRRYEPGYDFVQHKMCGLAAGIAAGAAGIRPNGYDRFTCLIFSKDGGSVGEPWIYTYHPEQAGGYGDELPMNVGSAVKLNSGQWYCFEAMLRANDVGVHNGEIKIWIDGELKAHYPNMRFRDTTSLKINFWCQGGYVGGSWTSERDQKLWDDNFAVATQYIGPMNTAAPSVRIEPVRLMMRGNSISIDFRDVLGRVIKEKGAVKVKIGERAGKGAWARRLD